MGRLLDRGHGRSNDIVELFLAGAEVVADAVASPEVAAAWDEPSVLEEQTVASLAGHLARGAVWLVADYLDDGEPEGPADLDGAADYFATFADSVTADVHQAIRDRGADGGRGRPRRARGRGARPPRRAGAAVCGPPVEPAGAGSPVGGCSHSDDYLATRLVEQTVHLDDLARSVGREPWPLPDAATELVCAVGVGVAQRRLGGTAVLRALYRRGFADAALPVL